MWTKEEENNLRKLYPNKTNLEIGLLLNKTKSQIDNKSYRLGLKKTSKFLKTLGKIGNQARINKGGRNLDYNELKKIALKYKTKIDFIQNDSSAYNTARIKGYLDEICSHMTVIKFSIPQLITRDIMDGLFGVNGKYNDRKTIKPYEIDIFYKDFNLGFEYQGIVWHENNVNDSIKSKIAKEKGITILYIHEYCGSRNYEKDIKKQIIDKIDIINKLSNKKITETDVLNYRVKDVYLELYNKDELIQIAKKYETFKEFKSKEITVYKKLLKLNLIEIATDHMCDKKTKKYNYSDSDLTNIIKKYDSLTDFRKDNLIIYKHIKRVKKDYLLSELKRKKTYSIEEIKNKINDYDNKTIFIIENEKMYKFMRVNKITHLISHLKRKKIIK